MRLGPQGAIAKRFAPCLGERMAEYASAYALRASADTSLIRPCAATVHGARRPSPSSRTRGNCRGPALMRPSATIQGRKALKWKNSAGYGMLSTCS